MLTSCEPLQSFLSVTVRTSSRTATKDIIGGQAATDDVGTDGSLPCSNGLTGRLNCCGESVLQMLAQNKAILSWCGDHCVGGVMSML